LGLSTEDVGAQHVLSCVELTRVAAISAKSVVNN